MRKKILSMLHWAKSAGEATPQNADKTATVDYETLFVGKNGLTARKSMYIAKELQDTLADIVMSMKNREMTLGIYVENIILHHLGAYKDEINSLCETKFRKPL